VSSPVEWGVGALLAAIAVGDILGAALPYFRIWLDIRTESRRSGRKIGFTP
jgi:hypothetical protein